MHLQRGRGMSGAEASRPKHCQLPKDCNCLTCAPQNRTSSYVPLAAAPTTPNPIACHVDESCGQGGGEHVSPWDLADRAIREAYPGDKLGFWGEHHRIPNFGILRGAIARIAYADSDKISRLQAEVERLKEEINEPEWDALVTKLEDKNALLQSRISQATAIINYLWLHTELDAIAKPDIDKFYAGSTDAEKAERAEMVRVANEPAEGGEL